MTATIDISRMDAAADELLGRPYRNGGRDPATGLDCWGVVVCVYRAMGWVIEDLPGYAPDWAAAGQDHMGRIVARGPTWSAVAVPEPGDVALYCTTVPGLADHAGLVLGPRWGVQQRAGALVSRYRLAAMAPWLYGYFRRRPCP